MLGRLRIEKDVEKDNGKDFERDVGQCPEVHCRSAISQ